MTLMAAIRSRAATRQMLIHAVDAARIVEVCGYAKHQSIDDAEHRRVCADAEAECQRDGCGEAGLGAQASERVVNVVSYRVHERRDAHTAESLADFVHENSPFTKDSRL